MSHYAQILDGKVVQVIVAEQDVVDNLTGEWVKTSYNTRGNVHYDSDGNPDGGVALRGNYAGLGYIYDRNNDVFYPPQPYPSYILNNSTWSWESPVPYPNDGKKYNWDEETISWVERN